MTTTVETRREMKKAAIVAAAWKLAREQGVVGVSLRALAHEVGVRQPSLYEYFDSKHVNPVRLATAGKGEADPVASNSTEAGRQLNRRVEIYVEPVRES